MSSPSALTRLLTAILLVCGTLSVTLVADSAAAAPAFKVTLNVSDSTPTVGQRVRFSGKVTPAADGRRVILQGKIGNSGWITVKRLRLSDNSTYRTALAFPGAGTVSMRVVKPRSNGSAKGISPARRIRISQAGPRILTSSLPNAVVGAPYSATIEIADGRTGNFAADTLPAGLTINLDTGVISGTPTTAGASNFRVWFRDLAGRVTSKPFTITVNPPGAAPTIITTAIPNGTVGSAYSVTLQTDGNRQGTWSLDSGTLPAGLSLSAAGVISGTPTATGNAAFTVKFTQTGGLSDTQALTMAVTPAGTPVISSTSPLPGGVINVPYSTTLKTVGNRNGTWTITSGTLQQGLTLSPAGVISGTPTTSSVQTFTVLFTAAGGGANSTASKQFTLDINPANQPVIIEDPLPPGIVGSVYNTALKNVGDKPGTWSLAPGSSLPAGLTLSSTGVISGTPNTPNHNAATTPEFDVRFDQTNGLSDTETFSIKINPNEPPVIAASTLPNAIQGQPYSATLRTVGNVSGTWAIASGPLPPGLFLHTGTGVIDGTPTAKGTYSFTARFTNLNGQTDTQAFSIVVP